MNVASRMESNSFPSCMHVSNSVVQQSQNQANMFVSLGERAIKGKGNMHTHLYKVAANNLLLCLCFHCCCGRMGIVVDGWVYWCGRMDTCPLYEGPGTLLVYPKPHVKHAKLHRSLVLRGASWKVEALSVSLLVLSC